MAGQRQPERAFAFKGGRLCLDFANTVRARPLSEREDCLRSYADLLSWARQAAILTADEAIHLAEEAEKKPRIAAAVLAQALSLREAIYGLFSARAARLPIAGDDLETINSAIGQAMAQAGLVPSAEGGFEWSWPNTVLGLDRIVWWVARSIWELSTSPDLTFIRECAGYDCGCLFMDTTKNHTRRWCDMKTCGNRAKGRRHYERTKTAHPQTNRQSFS